MAYGKAIKIPRTEVHKLRPGRYERGRCLFSVLLGRGRRSPVYIGEAENVLERLNQHLRDYQTGKEKYYWNTAVIFVGRDLNKALIRYLENRLVEIARDSKSYVVLTKNTYKNTVMKESQVAVMEEFIENVKILISTLGL